MNDMGLRLAVRAHLRDAPCDASPERLDELIVDEALALDGVEHFSGLRQIGLEGTLVVDL